MSVASSERSVSVRSSVYIELSDIETYSLDVVSIGHVLYLSFVAYLNHTQTVRKPYAEHTQTTSREHAQLNARSLRVR